MGGFDEAKQKIKEIFDEINKDSHPLGTKSWLHQYKGQKLRVLAVLDDLQKTHILIEKKQLQEIINHFPKYPDDVGGMYSYEVQMYGADVEKVLDKIKELFEKAEKLLGPDSNFEVFADGTVKYREGRV